MLPVTVALYILVAQFVQSEKFCFLHSYVYLYFHIRFLIHCCLGKTTKLPGLVSTFFLQHDHLIVQYANFYGCAYVLCQTCHLLHLQWFFLNSILLSGDVELNPGPNTSMFSFCSWNLNSITAHDFVRVSLIEAYNSIYEYDLLGIVETHIDSFVDETKLLIPGYTFVKSNHPSNTKRGGVGLYIKETFPARERPDLVKLPESIVCEIQLNQRKHFFALIYRSPSQTLDEFDIFMENFELMLSSMSIEEPYCIIITGDFNCRSPHWWKDERENDEGRIFEAFTAELGLQQLVCEPTHFIGESKSCIDLIFTNQPNLFLETGVHPTLHRQCHHHVVFAKITAHNLTPPSYKRKLWYYDRANIPAIKKSIELYNWQEIFQDLECPNLQVEAINDVLTNIFSNFIPNEIKTIRPRQAPWITQSIKNFIRKKNRAYKNFVKNGRPDNKLADIQDMILQSSKIIEEAKSQYFKKIGRTLSNSKTSQKTYWSLINKIMNKAKIPVIPPLLEKDIFVLDFESKAQIFNDYFVGQCTTIDTGSEVPSQLVYSAPPLTEFQISEEKILSIIRSLNPNKAHGWDNISVRMIKICDDSLVLPLKLIFENCLRRGVFPEVWKKANVVPVHKKNSKNHKQNYRPISLLPVLSKVMEKLIFDSLYEHLSLHEMLNPCQSGFRPGDSL